MSPGTRLMKKHYDSQGDQSDNTKFFCVFLKRFKTVKQSIQQLKTIQCRLLQIPQNEVSQ